MKQILLIEDNINDAELTIEALEINNVKNPIDIAGNGEVALDYLYKKGDYKNRKTNHPIFILLDIKMPKINGLEFLKIIKDDPKLQHIPIVILTSSKEEQDIIEAYSLCVNAYVVKPVDFEGFVSTIRNIARFWIYTNQSPINSH